jgi:hypothetical protein
LIATPGRTGVVLISYGKYAPPLKQANGVPDSSNTINGNVEPKH